MMTARYAVLMKVHYWDDFTERRLRHLIGKVGAGDVYVFVDETHRPVGHIAYDRVIRATERDMTKLETTLYPLGKVFWYNVDYPLYYFYLQNKSYDYYLMCEHDAVFNIDIDEFVRTADRNQVDYVGFPLARTNWPLHTCEGVYPDSFKLHQWLNCISLHSNRSVEFLLQRRRLLAPRYTAGEIKSWPMNEAFIPTEMLNNGFAARSLADFGKVDKYNWWPPSHEDDIPILQDQAFLHPVLGDRRYIASCIQQSNLWTYFWPGSQLRKLLGRGPPLSSIPAFLNELSRRFVRQVLPPFILEPIRQFRGRNSGAFQRFLRRLTHPN
jgi:hypothetical protein